MPTQADNILTEVLIERGYLTREVLDPIVLKAATNPGGLAPLLVAQKLVSEDVILGILAERLNIKRVDFLDNQVDKAAVEKVPLKIAEYYKFMPLKLENKKLTVATPFLLDTRTQDSIRTLLGFDVEIVLAREADVTEALKKWYGLGAATIEKILKTSVAEESSKAVVAEASEKVEEIEKQTEDASVINLVNQILTDAFKKRATDIHIEPYRGKVKIRYRVDGVLQNTNVPSEIKQFIMSIVSRIKIMSNLNIIEKRLPQDGRAIIKIAGETIDLRVSSIPTPSGESIVIRLLPMTRLFSLEKLGLEKTEISIFKSLIEKPHGIIFITGPTGSGKSTTLYACLSMINTDERKIITIEDPVEYEMEGITQIQVVPQIGLDFAKGLKSILRHDPDVIMVGEVRDLETAETAARVALTGHLVFSTLHTNDAASGVTRLVDIGVEPYLVASSVEAFIAQRLVRMICTHCKQEDKKQPDELRAQITQELKLPSIKDVKLYRGKGCEKCNFSGFWGRVAIFEILLVDDEIRGMIMKRVPAGEIKKAALAKGMRTLRQSGWQKVISGFTTPEEILEVAPDEIAMAEADAIELEKAREQKPNLSVVRSIQESKPQKHSEKRNFIRLSMEAVVRYRVLQGAELSKWSGKIENFGVVKNLSAGGLLFMAKEQIKLGSILELTIELPHTKEAIQCLSRTVRVTLTETDNEFDVSVCFLDLSGADRAKLDQFVSEEVF